MVTGWSPPGDRAAPHVQPVPRGYRPVTARLPGGTGESVIIGDDITVTVLGVKGNQVRLGIEAPADVAINREEIHRRIIQEKSHLATGASSYQET